jgi:hypothetical protein
MNRTRSRMSVIRAAAVLCTMAMGPGACTASWQHASTAAEVRPAQDVPVRFVTTAGMTPGDGCRSPLVDPRDHAVLRLERSMEYGMTYHGDYDVPTGRYGVQRGELLRLDCATGEVVGIVRR